MGARLFFWLLFSASLLVGGCGQDGQQPQHGRSEPQPRTGGIYRAALPFEPKTLDPAFSTDIYAVTLIQQLFDGLVQFDKNLNVVPALARTWQVSADGRSYTFELRPGVRFHNGRPVVANDVVYSFSRIVAPGSKSSALGFFLRLEGAPAYHAGRAPVVSGLRALDGRRVLLRLREPFAPFMSLLAMKSSKIVPREEVEKGGSQFGRQPIGTGAFRLRAWQGNKIVLEANPDYFGGRPYLDEVVYTIYPGARHREVFQDFEAGRLEEAFVTGAIRERVRAGGPYQYYRKPSLSLMFYGMNCADAALRDRRVRRAIAEAIDKRKITEEIFGGQFVTANSVLPPGMMGYTPENQTYGYNPEHARQLLAEAGYDRDDQLTLTLLSASKSQVAQRELAQVTADLAKVGIELKVVYETDWPTFEKKLRSPSLQLYRYAWFADIPDPDNFLGVLFSSTSPYNFMRYHDQQVDSLLQQALRETDVLQRVEIYRRAEKRVLAAAPIYPLIYLVFESVFQPYVRGVEITALGGPYVPLKKVWLASH